MKNKFRAAISLMLCIVFMATVLVPCVTAVADGREIIASGITGDVNWCLYDDGELYIYGEGAMEDFSSYTNQPWHAHRSSIRSINVSEGVTYIGSYCFSVTAAKTAFIPSSVMSIGDAAFLSCHYLENATISYGVKTIGFSAFAFSGLKSVTLPDSITEMKMYCFQECENLESVVISNNISRVYGKTFYECTNLKTVTFGKKTTYLSESLFYGCTALESVYYGGTLKDWCSIYISTETGNPLAYADKLYLNGELVPAELVIPDTCSNIGQYAFYGASFIESVVLPPSITSVGDSAFQGCINLKTINIPAKVKRINSNAFESCNNLTSINVDAKNEYFSSDSDGVLYNKDKTELIQYPIGRKNTDFVVPDTVETIGSYAFYNCKNLSKITLPQSIKRIEEYAFNGCASLTTINVTDSVEYVGGYAFNNSGYYNDRANWDNGFLYLNTLLIAAEEKNVASDCKLYSKTTLVASNVFYSFDITSISFNDKLKYINDSAFQGCAKIKSINLPKSLVTVGKYAFRSCAGVECLTLNYGLSEIGWYAFDGLKKITEIYIPETVTQLSSDAFSKSGVTDIYYGSSKADWKRVAAGETFDGITVHYTLSNDDKTVIINHTDADFDYEAGNVHLVVSDLSDITPTFDKNTFYNRYMVKPIQVLDIKLVDGDGNPIQPLSDEKITVKIKATDEFMNLIKSGLSDMGEYDVEAEEIGFADDCFVFESNGQKISVAANEKFLNKFRIFHWYSDAANPTDYECFTHDKITVENGYIILETNHFSEYAVCTDISEPESYTVKWIVDGVVTEQNVTEGDALYAPETPEKEGHTFVGWSSAVPETMPAENLEFTAQWQVNEYTITFDTAGGSEIAAVTLEYGAATTATPNPDKEGYTFIGWLPEIPETMPAENITVVAQYKKAETPENPENPAAKMTGIKIISAPNKTKYAYKIDSLDLNGIAVKLNYSDGTSKIITDTDLLKTYGFSVDSVGTKTITVSYGGYTDDFEVTVSYTWWQMIIRILLLGFLWY